MGQKELTTFFIYIGGGGDPAALPRPAAGTRIYAADIGYRLAVACGVVPELLLGDFDSLGDCPLPPGMVCERVAPEKDETDTMLAIDRALAQGAKEIVLLGGLGGRFDHALANLCLLDYLAGRGVRGLLTDGQNRVRYLTPGTLTLTRGPYHYFSLLPVGEKAGGVSLRGAKYPLDNACLDRTRAGFGVSNEFAAQTVTVTLGEGALYLIESNP